MRAARAAAWALLALGPALGAGAAAGRVAQGPAADGAAPAAAAPRPDPLAGEPLGLEAIEAELRALAELHPGVARLEEIGRSRGGRPLLVLALTGRARGEAEGKPALLLFDALGPADGPAAEAALLLARELAEGAGPGGALEELLAERAVYVAPALEPDLRAGEAPAEGTPLFARSFPVGWLPGTLTPGGGRVPLAEPGPAALARFLATHPNVAVLVAAAAPAAAEPAGAPPAAVADEDREAHELLRARGDDPGRPRLLAFEECARGGGPCAYAWEAFGIVPALLAPPADPLDPARRRDFVRGAAEVARALVLDLPRLGLGEPTVERLGPTLAQIDLVVANHGRLPTSTVHAGARRPDDLVRLGVEGARVLACARREGDAFVVLAASDRAAGGSVAIGRVAGGGRSELRLVLEASAGTPVRLVVSSPRAGRAERTIEL